jgi:hypothetical protein
MMPVGKEEEKQGAEGDDKEEGKQKDFWERERILEPLLILLTPDYYLPFSDTLATAARYQDDISRPCRRLFLDQAQ